MNFSSDNTTPIAPEILQALIDNNKDDAHAYGNDDHTLGLSKKFSDLFETKVWAYPVITGTAANCLALSTITPPYGAIYCHEESHINSSEGTAPAFFTHGAKLIDLPGEDGKLHPLTLKKHLSKDWQSDIHKPRPAALSLTQATECGTIYDCDELQELCHIAHHHDLKTHMDGARFANALVSLDCTPAEMTWKSGIDVLCFGATKNGAMGAEIVLFFNEELAKNFEYIRKSTGHLLSKLKFVSVQLEASLKDNRWLNYAKHANKMAKKLYENLKSIPDVEFLYKVSANELFIHTPETVIEALIKDGFHFYKWPLSHNKTAIRLVCSFNTKQKDVDLFIQKTKEHCIAL